VVIPGGIDVHTHMELPFGGTFASDTFETGSNAAAWGGTTTIIDMAVQRYGEDVHAGLAEWHRKADGNCSIDYGFHQIIGGVDDESLKALKYLTEHEGISSFKLFMAYPGVFYSDDGQILRAMQTAAECGAMIMMHAENGIAIDVLVQQALSRNETDPRYHSYTRPSPLEAEATHRAIVLSHVAGNVPLYIVHMSAGDALNEVAAARHHGRNVFAETCPQYLYLTLERRSASRASRVRSGSAAHPCAARTTTPTTSGRWGTATRAICGRACA
jgi:dihydropyrimidinase